MLVKLALRQTWRDARAGDLLLLGLAIMIAVAALSSVSFLANRVNRALERDAAQMLGADLLVESDSPITPDLPDRAESDGLQTTQTWQFPTMVGSQELSLLTALKAVGVRYPLRGQLRIASASSQVDQPVATGPEPGRVWVDPQVLNRTGLKLGDALNVGDITLLIERIITYEPDRGTQFMNLAPRVMISAADLERTGLITLGSRVTFALLVAGPLQKIDAYRQWISPRLKKGQKLVSFESGRPEIKRSLDRAQQFLVLVALLAALIAALAIVLGARQFEKRHLKTVAVIRCLGATQSLVTRIFVLEFILVGVVASLAGILIGAICQSLIVQQLGVLLGANLPDAEGGVVLQSLALGILLLLALSWPSLQMLRFVSPSLILRSQVCASKLQVAIRYLPAALCTVGLMCWVAADFRLGASLALGFFLATLVFSLSAYGLLALLARLRHLRFVSPEMRFALSGLIRRRHVAVLQTTALALGTMAILLLAIVRTDLIEGWQRTLPANAPNRFVLNIQTSQLENVKNAFDSAGLTSTTFFPMVRGRLISRNGVPTGAEDFTELRAKQLIEREFNLTYTEHLPQVNQITSGRDLDPLNFEVSLESGLADTLGLRLGDILEFDVAGALVSVKVTSIRKIDWDSMQANFFAILTTRALRGQPETWMSAFHVEPSQAQWLQDLIRRLPNLTVFDLGAILAELKGVLGKVSLAVQALFGFSLVAGIVVLAGALLTTRDERIHEAAILRALGATKRQLVRSQRVELVMTGLLAGSLAAAGAYLVSWYLARWVFHFAISVSLGPWLLSILICILGSWLVGVLTLGGVLRMPPTSVLRHVG